MKNGEVEYILNLERRKLNSLVIRWEVTRFCNYSCDFCIQGSKEMHIRAFKEESPDIRREIVKSLVGFLENEVNPHKIVEIKLIGGEVTALPDFKELLAQLVNCKFKGGIIFYITTNFSRPSQYFCDLFSLFDGRPGRALFVSVSFYRRFTTPQILGEKLRTLFNKVDRPVKNYFKLRWRLLSAMPGRFIDIPKWQKIFVSVGVPIEDDDSWALLQNLRKDYGKYVRSFFPIIIRDYPVDISEDVQRSLKRGGVSESPRGNSIRVSLNDGSKLYFSNIQHLGYQIEGQETFNPSGYICDAGTNSFSVSPDGSVMRCPVLNPPQDFYMGKLTDSSFRILTTPKICHAGHCSCNAFAHIKRDD